MAPPGTDVFGTMRYGQPSLKEFLLDLHKKDYSKVMILPLYPQYADSTTGSVEQLVAAIQSNPGMNTHIKIIDQFYDHPGFISCFAERIRAHDPSAFDHVLFSYHGLPLRQLQKIHPDQPVPACTCEDNIPE
jgi:ferrochelatase